MSTVAGGMFQSNFFVLYFLLCHLYKFDNGPIRSAPKIL